MAGHATDSNEAMRLAVTTEPDIALVAASSRDGDAIHLVSRLATELGIPCVLLSHAADERSISQAAASGVMGLLVRPVDPGSLQAMLEVAICRFRDLLSLRREAEVLRRALEDRKVVERAKGLLMQMEALSEQEAVVRIRQKSLDAQRSMAVIARAIILAAGLIGKPRLSAVSPRN